ncbi:MAG TPA: hypothetical protein VN932_13495 [Rhizomicrobium sp.]|nr:hypothetical protein [Rhizomicrobium sp.]
MAGYSGTPLVKKLGIKPGTAVLALNAPKDYAKLLGPLPQGATITGKVPQGGAAIVHLFVTSLAELEKQLPRSRKAMTIDGAIWVSWYKQAAKIPTDVTEGVIRNRALKTDLVDVKVCAVSEVWSGLKLVVRKALR